jgi:hypothetical protein
MENDDRYFPFSPDFLLSTLRPWSILESGVITKSLLIGPTKFTFGCKLVQPKFETLEQSYIHRHSVRLKVYICKISTMTMAHIAAGKKKGPRGARFS